MDLQSLCQAGQESLVRTDYLAAEATLMQAEEIARDAQDWDTLSRLYMPLQEARRQIRQRAGEGIVCLDLLAHNADDQIRAEHVIQNIPHGQVLVAGWGSIAPALELRRLAIEHQLYLETFLAAVYPIGDSRAVVIVPHADVHLPEVKDRSIDALIAQAPRQSIVLHVNELPPDRRKGDAATFSEVSTLWERLHAPFLALADAEKDPVRKIAAYRKTIEIDRACELAHQGISGVCRRMMSEEIKSE